MRNGHLFTSIVFLVLIWVIAMYDMFFPLQCCGNVCYKAMWLSLVQGLLFYHDMQIFRLSTNQIVRFLVRSVSK